MKELDQQKLTKLNAELNNHYPDLNPLISEIREKSFTFQLEKHGNYQYYIVNYTFALDGNVKIDWESAELTVI